MNSTKNPNIMETAEQISLSLMDPALLRNRTNPLSLLNNVDKT